MHWVVCVVPSVFRPRRPGPGRRLQQGLDAFLTKPQERRACSRVTTPDMGLMPSGGGARSAARAGLSAALGLSLLGSAAAARGQTDQDGFYVGIEVGRANASTLTSVVTGVNHPTRCDRLL